MAARDAKRARAAVDAEPFGFAGAVPPTAPRERLCRSRARRLRSAARASARKRARGGDAEGARRVAASDVDEPLPSFVDTSAVSDAFGRVDGVTCPAPFALATDRRGEAARGAGVSARAKGAP